MTEERKGLRFEVYENDSLFPEVQARWEWSLVGAEGCVAVSPCRFYGEEEARKHIAANRGRLKAAARSKVLTVDYYEDD